MTNGNDAERLYTLQDVSRIFQVDPKTVTRWRKAGKIRAQRMPSGQHRYPESAVQALLGADEPLSHPPLAHPVYQNPAVTIEDL